MHVGLGYHSRFEKPNPFSSKSRFGNEMHLRISSRIPGFSGIGEIPGHWFGFNIHTLVFMFQDVGESTMVMCPTIRRTWEPWEPWQHQGGKRSDGADAKGYVEEVAMSMVGWRRGHQGMERVLCEAMVPGLTKCLGKNHPSTDESLWWHNVNWEHR